MRLLQIFDAQLVEDYLSKVREFHHKIGNYLDLKHFEWLYYESDEPFAFLINLDEPLLLLLSHPISRFLRARKYFVLNNECKLCFDLALVPAYLAPLNIYTVIRFWSEGARRFFSPTSAPLSEEEECWALYPTSGGAQWSSMNYLLKKEADARFAPKHLQDLAHDYFTYFFWCHPRRGFSSCAHFIHDDKNVRTLLKVSKTIYSIKGVYDDSLVVGPNEMQVKRAIASGLTFDGQKPRIITSTPILTSDILTDMKELENRRFFINGVVSEFRRRGETRLDTLTVVAEWGVNQIELLMALIGIVVWNRFRISEQLSYVGKVEEIKRDCDALFGLLTKHVRLDRSFADAIKDPFQYALTLLFPLIANDGESVYFAHPYLFVSFEKYGLAKQVRSRESLLPALKLLDKSQVKTERELYSCQEASAVAKSGIPKWHLIKALEDSVKGIVLSKVLHLEFVDKEEAGEEIESPRSEQDLERYDGSANLCPECLGKGVIVEYVEQDMRTRVRIRPVTKKCHVCNGRGFLSTKIND
jgi:hypothetical protein